jgi:hypothetical protein
VAPDFATLDSGATASMIPMEKVIDRRLKMAAIMGVRQYDLQMTTLLIQ